MIWLILLTIGVAYAMYSIGKFADDLKDNYKKENPELKLMGDKIIQ